VNTEPVTNAQVECGAMKATAELTVNIELMQHLPVLQVDSDRSNCLRLKVDIGRLAAFDPELNYLPGSIFKRYDLKSL
jgi:hypothetical protein